jgi:hypothetical protein
MTTTTTMKRRKARFEGNLHCTVSELSSKNTPTYATKLKCLILLAVLIHCFVPVRPEHRLQRPRDSLATTNDSGRQFQASTGRNGSLPVANNNNKTQVGDSREAPVASTQKPDQPDKRQILSVSSADSSPKEPTARIATLDDLSHRLDQTRENVSLVHDDTRAPFWNIAHMINSIEQVDLALG